MGKALGVAVKTRQYDLPLHQDESTGFLIVLVMLMTFLMALALSFSFGISQLMSGWSDGLENRLTVEIPAELENGEARAAENILDIQVQVKDLLIKNESVDSVEIISDEDLKQLVQPWLGTSSIFEDLPLPGLLSVEMTNNAPDILFKIEKSLQKIAPDIRIDTHEKWLADLFRLTQSLQVVIICFVSIIGMTTVAAVAGAVKSQIEIHRGDVELLHLMGAYDSYITRQFVRHASIIVLIGGAVGILASLVVLLLIGLFLGAQDYTILPSLDFSWTYIGWLLILPLFLWFISAISTRLTVMRVLSREP